MKFFNLVVAFFHCFICFFKITNATFGPTRTPTFRPSRMPSSPAFSPSNYPTDNTIPTSFPSPTPTSSPTPIPTSMPASSKPTSLPIPSSVPTNKPTSLPTSIPTSKPTSTPISKPTSLPIPSSVPTSKPTLLPTSRPTSKPTSKPTFHPSFHPASPVFIPTSIPTSNTPSSPTSQPSMASNLNTFPIYVSIILDNIELNKLSQKSIKLLSDYVFDEFSLLVSFSNYITSSIQIKQYSNSQTQRKLGLTSSMKISLTPLTSTTTSQIVVYIPIITSFAELQILYASNSIVLDTYFPLISNQVYKPTNNPGEKFINDLNSVLQNAPYADMIALVGQIAMTQEPVISETNPSPSSTSSSSTTISSSTKILIGVLIGGFVIICGLIYFIHHYVYSLCSCSDKTDMKSNELIIINMDEPSSVSYFKESSAPHLDCIENHHKQNPENSKEIYQEIYHEIYQENYPGDTNPPSEVDKPESLVMIPDEENR